MYTREESEFIAFDSGTQTNRSLLTSTNQNKLFSSEFTSQVEKFGMNRQEKEDLEHLHLL